MTLHDDRTFVRHFSWVILFLAIMLIVFIFLSFLIVGTTGVEDHSGYSYVQYMQKHHRAAAPASSSEASEAQATMAAEPSVAQVMASDANAENMPASGHGASEAANGETIWKAHCSMCHATGVAGAPKIGDTKAWGEIFKKTNLATLYDHAIHGFSGDLGYMPPRGGAMNLSDPQVKAAVDYMIKKSGWQGG